MTTCSTNRSCVFHDTALLLMRLMLGVVFMYHGAQKTFGLFGGPGISNFAGFLEGMGIPYPTLSAILAACAEFFGGLAVLLGVGVRLAVLPMIFTMLVAAFKAHGNAFSLQHGGMEYALTLAVMLTALGLMGGGRCTLPAILRRRRNEAQDAAPTPSP